MPGTAGGRVKAFHPRPLHIAKLKDCLVLIKQVGARHKAELLGGQGQGCWGGVHCHCELWEAMRSGDKGAGWSCEE